jgi:hypothetical protein
MPPIGRRIGRNSAEREGRILLALQALQNEQLPSIVQTAKAFNILASTLYTRL